jgi:Protein of unknown function (DUF1353)
MVPLTTSLGKRIPCDIITIDRTAEVYKEAYQALPSWKRFFARWTPFFRPEVNACFELAADWLYIAQDGEVYLVPKGFRFDYASIPQAVQNIIPKMGPWNPGALLHDWLYKTGFFGTAGRLKADKLLLEVMLYCNVDKATAETIFDGVRVGGGSSWAADKVLAIQYRVLFQSAIQAWIGQYNLAVPAPMPELTR